MGTEMGLMDSSAALESTTLSYTASSETVALPAGAKSQPIFMIEDVTDSTYPVRLGRLSTFDASSVNASAGTGYAWARFGETVALKPKPSVDVSLRIWYIREPYVIALDGSGDETTGTDQHAMPVGHEEIISLGAAIRLQEVDGEIPNGRIERYNEMWMRFLQAARKSRGPKYIRRNRRFG